MKGATPGRPEGIGEAAEGVKTARETGRLLYLEAAKGIGILLVVLGHNNWLIKAAPALITVIYSVHMPLFFFVAGIFLKRRSDLGRLALERADAYLKPFAVVVLLLAVAPALRGDAVVAPLVLSLFYGTSNVLPWGPLWFLPHLWLLGVVVTAVLTWGDRLLSHRLWRAALLGFMVLAGAQWLGGFHPPDGDLECIRIATFTPQVFACGLPYSADLIGVTGFYLLCGYLSCAAIRRGRFPALGLIAALAIVVVWWAAFRYRINLNDRLYDHPIVSTIQALAAIYAVLATCALLTPHLGPLMRLLAYVGQASLFILLFHYRVQELLLQRAQALHAPGVAAALFAAAASVALCCAIAALARAVPMVGHGFLPRLRRRPAAAPPEILTR